MVKTLTLLVLTTAVAHADALDKGRALEAAGKHAAAIKVYEAALDKTPDDPVLEAELGYSALQAKDYTKAEAATQTAIAHASGRTLGAALYNLGQIQEATQRSHDAIVSYVGSLQARPSKVVREHLQRLDADTARAVDPLAAAVLPGPFPSVKAACADWLVRHGMDATDTWGSNGSCDQLDTIAIGGKIDSPFTGASAFQMIDRSSFSLAVQTQDGWFRFDYEGKGHRSQAHCGGTRFVIAQTAVAKHAGATELEVEYSSDGSCDHHDHAWGWTEDGTVLIGLGASGKPAAPPPIITSQREWAQTDGHPQIYETEASAFLRLNKDGSLDVTGTVVHSMWPADQALPADDLDPEKLLGHHLIAFP